MQISPVKVIELTTNRKTGPVSVTMASQETCPSSCPWFKSGCYAESGPQGIHTHKLNKSPITDPLEIAKLHAEGIDNLSATNDLRLNIVGDLSTDSCVQVVAQALKRYSEKSKSKKFSTKIWAYTHGKTQRSSWGPNISILRSCETLEHVKEAFDNDFAAALVVENFNKNTAYTLKDKSGNEFVGIPCPQQTKQNITCKTCRLCMNEDKLKALKRVILFSAHGTGKKKMLPVLNNS